MKRIAAGVAVVAVVAIVLVGGIRLATAATPITGYRIIDDYNIAVQIIGSKAQWRGVTVDETASTVSIDLKEIWIHGPGFDDDIAYVAIRLHDPLGDRRVVDSSGNPVPLREG